MTSIIYRNAEAPDLAVVKELLASCDLPNHDVQAHLHAFIIAEIAGRIVGTIGLEADFVDQTERGTSSLDDGVGLLRSLAVAESHRDRGIARELVARLTAAARSRGIRRLFLLTTTAADYFVRHGFAVVDRSSVPAPIRSTLEFSSLCPSSAVCMVRTVEDERCSSE